MYYLGESDFDWICKNAKGQLGGIPSVWRSGIFNVQFTFSGKHFVGVCIEYQGNICYCVNVYSACDMVVKRRLWDELRGLKCEFVVGDWCAAGDFNVVMSKEERKGDNVTFNQIEMREFEAFMHDMELVDVLVLGKKFSWFGADGRTMSRIDRFLLSEGLITKWNINAQWIGDRDISDHCPIWLVSSNLNWVQSHLYSTIVGWSTKIS